MKKQISEYPLKGKISAWKYVDNQRNYPGINIYIERKLVSEILKLITLMKNCEWSSQKKIQLDQDHSLLSIPNNQNGLAKAKFKSELSIVSKKENSEFSIDEKGDRVELNFGIDSIIEFEMALLKYQNGANDFGVADEKENHILTFW